jgi:hypothetical protein
MVVKTQLSFICYAVIQISNYNYIFRPYLVAIIRLYILSFKSFFTKLLKLRIYNLMMATR